MHASLHKHTKRYFKTSHAKSVRTLIIGNCCSVFCVRPLSLLCHFMRLNCVRRRVRVLMWVCAFWILHTLLHTNTHFTMIVLYTHTIVYYAIDRIKMHTSFGIYRKFSSVFAVSLLISRHQQSNIVRANWAMKTDFFFECQLRTENFCNLCSMTKRH